MGWDPNQGQNPQGNPNQGQDPNAFPGYGQQTPPPQYPGYDPNMGGAQQNPYSGNTPGQQQYQSYQSGYNASSTNQWGPTSMGLEANVGAGLSYVLGWLTGLIFYFVEKQNRFVRFHASQSIILFGAYTILEVVLGIVNTFLDTMFSLSGSFFLTTMLSCINGLILLGIGILYIVLLIQGFTGKYFKLPVIGDFAERMANKTF